MPTAAWIRSRDETLNLLQRLGYTPDGEYARSNFHMKVKCPVGHSINITPNNFKRKPVCDDCGGHSSRVAADAFFALLKDLSYTLESPYDGSVSKVKIRCSVGHAWDVSPHKIKSGRRCPSCNDLERSIPLGRPDPLLHRINSVYTQKRRRLGQDSFLELLNEIGYTKVGEYINTDTPIALLCDKGHTISMVPYHLKAGHRCRLCSHSIRIHKGELMVQKCLDELGIQYHHDKTGFFETNKKMKPDFFIPHLNLIIEYDGQQHFQDSPMFRQKMSERRQIDEFKDSYCFNRRVHLARIPWTVPFGKIENVVNEALQMCQGNHILLTACRSDYYANPKALPSILWPDSEDKMPEVGAKRKDRILH